MLVAFSPNAARQGGSEALLLFKTATAVVCRLQKPHPPPRASLRVASCRISTSTLPGGSCITYDSSHRFEDTASVGVKVAGCSSIRCCC